MLTRHKLVSLVCRPRLPLPFKPSSSTVIVRATDLGRAVSIPDAVVRIFGANVPVVADPRVTVASLVVTMLHVRSRRGYTRAANAAIGAALHGLESLSFCQKEPLSYAPHGRCGGRPSNRLRRWYRLSP